jgi:protein-S-isoprenylcysteine O-methyltransferase Ste14
MYAGALVMLLGTPLGLGSFWGLLVLLPMLAAIIWRLLDEERVLSRDLPGYIAYRSRVRARLIPGVW